jgi:sugar porter (SP) family MFS transporter
MTVKKNENTEDAPHVDQRDKLEPDMMLKDAAPKMDKMWWHYPHLRKLNFFLFGAILVQATNGYDGSMLNGLQSLNVWENYFGHPAGASLGTLSSGTTFGGLLVLFPAAYICDKFGRRWPIIAGSILTIIGAIVQGVAQNFGTFWAGRFIIGMGLGLLGNAAPLLLAETAYPTQRPVLTALYETSFPFGALVGALITFGSYYIDSTWAWRLPSLLQCFPAFIQIGLVYVCPESPRWLVAQGRIEEARTILVQYHGAGDEDSLLVRLELEEIQAALQSENIKKSGKWSQWLKTKGNRHRLGIIMFIPVITQLSGNRIISYYLHLILNGINITTTRDQLIINATLLASEVISAVGIASYCEMFGRRRYFLIGIIGMLISFIPWTVLSALAQEGNFSNPGYGIGVVAMIYIFMVPYHIVAPLANLFMTEVAPYELRSKASAIFSLTGNVIGLFSSYVNPIAMDAIGWKYYIVYCCVIAVQIIVVYFYFPETKGLSLEEVSVIFEGEAAAVGAGAYRHGDVEDPVAGQLTQSSDEKLGMEENVKST